jgi:hypothetical protein
MDTTIMKCEKCNKDGECYTVPIYFAEVLSKVENEDTDILKRKVTNTTVTRYSSVQIKNYKLCTDCSILFKKRGLQLRSFYALLYLTLIGIGIKFFELIDIISQNIFNIILYILIGILIITIISAIIGLAKKKYLKINSVDAYFIAMKFFEKDLKKKSKESNYEFWNYFPDHLDIKKN